MLKTLTNVTVALLSTVVTSTAMLPTPSFATSSNILQEVTSKETELPNTKIGVPEKPKAKRLICKSCNQNEIVTLNFLQDHGVTDKKALATIMGNIRQESTFIPNICEGGSRVPYHQCKSGGVGILQWTDHTRYYGLGRFAARIGGDPSSLDTQLRYMMHEIDWKNIEQRMKTPGGSIEYYMRLARTWIRWGHKGPRTDYAYDYVKRIGFSET